VAVTTAAATRSAVATVAADGATVGAVAVAVDVGLAVDFAGTVGIAAAVGVGLAIMVAIGLGRCATAACCLAQPKVPTSVTVTNATSPRTEMPVTSRRDVAGPPLSPPLA